MSYDYKLREGSIANNPAEPRDSAKLLVVNTKTGDIKVDIFANISKFLPENSLLVLNDTKVIPARLELTKATGGKVRILFLVNEMQSGQLVKGLADRKLVVGDQLFLDDDKGPNDKTPIVKIVAQNKGEFVFEVLVPMLDFSSILKEVGQTPLPPYIHTDLSEEEAREKYQTIYSKENFESKNGLADMFASVAAPTASLHFTDRVFQSFEAKNIEKTFVTLHVGRGTFAHVDEKVTKLHEEPVYISEESAAAILQAKKEGRTVIASGTTAVRVLESSSDNILAEQGYSGSTSIFIKPPYDFKIVDAMITNFHLPNTSLLQLLDAFLQYKKSPKSWREIYNFAMENDFKFYSFGDAMLVI